MRLQLTSFAHPVAQQHLRSHLNRQYLKIRNLNVCRVCVHAVHKIPYSAGLILRDPSHVLFPSLRQRYERISKGQYDEFQEGLWLTVTSNPMQRTKVVRSWARRRMDQAVKQALRTNGFDSNGRKIEDGTLSVERQGNNVLQYPQALVGTVDIEVMDCSVLVAYEEVQRQASLVVDEILRVCGRQLRKSSTSLRGLQP